MKHFLRLFLLLLPFCAQAQLSDNFTDGNFTANPTWTGDAASFQVTAQQLQSNGPAVTGTYLQLAAPCQASTGTVWEFWANLRLATSSGNLADVWLMASQADLKSTTTKGYYVRLGGTNDEISLFRKDSARTAVLLIDGLNGTLASTTNNLVRVRVTRSLQNVWTLERDLTGGRTFVAEAGTPTDATHQRSAAAGVLLLYSSANNRSFYFDDFLATDTTAPQLTGTTPQSARLVDLVFNEAVDPASATLPGNYRLQSGLVPTAAQALPQNPAVVRLTFGTDFAAQNTLEVRNVADLFGNVAAGPQLGSFAGPAVAPLAGELIISEIFADETPQVGLPLSEYVEIYNRSATKVLSLRGVRLGKGSSSTFAVFADTARLLPGQYAVVCGSTRISQFAAFNAKVYGPTNFPSLTNSSDQLVLRGRDGRVLFEVSYADTWYNDPVKRNGGWSLEMIDTDNLCAGATNWAASNDASGGTPGRANSIRANNPDNAPPTLLRAELPDPLTLRLTFSEKLDSAAATASRYALVAPAPGIVRVTPIGPDFRQVDLTLDTPLTTSQRTVVTVQMATDCAGNVSGALQAVSFVELAVAPLVGELVISEIFADETPAVGLPASEYVEIYNRSATKVLSLGGVRLGKGSSTTNAVFADTMRLRPGQYAVVCGSTRVSQFAAFNAKVYGLTNFPALTNAGDQLVLRGRDGATLFEVTYSDTWYSDPMKKDGGWSLEMIDANNLCAGADNWRASTDASGGTPGRANSIRANNPDNAPPTLLRAELPDPLTLRLTFSEKLDSTAAANPARYALVAPAPGIVRVTPVGPDFRQVDLTLDSPLTTSQRTVVTVQTATDCAGNVSGALQAVSFVEPASAPLAGELIITEIFADETPVVGLPESEYLEIYNRSATKVLDLGGVRLGKTSTASHAVFPDTARLRPGQYAIVCGSTRGGLFAGLTAKVYPLSSFPALTNGGDQLVLGSRTGGTLFEVTYSDGWYGDPRKQDGGWSLEMKDPDNLCAGASNWAASTDASGGTPGRANSIRAANPDTAPPTLLRAVAVDATTLLLTFSEKLDSARAATASRYVLAAPGPVVASATPLAPDFRQVQLTLATALPAGQPTTLTVQTATDCAGNASGALQSVSFALPEAAVAGDVVVNEILFNPRTNAVDFVEIINRSNKYVSLQGWQLANEKADGSTDTSVLTAGPLVLGPGELLAFTTNAGIIQTEYPTSHDLAHLLEVDDFPTFPDDAGIVLLSTNVGIIIDRFAYNEDMHLSLLSSQDGVSLERIRTNGPSVGSNFHSAAGAVGYATPGRPNSQAQDAVGGNQELSITPEVFTPDDDGQQDFTTLNFHLDQPGYAASVTVYDALGRLTRNLVRNQSLPVDGFVQWDGLDERGRKATVGYYILLIELFRPSGGEKREYKKTVVLGARF
jgi:hypothetical protein